MANAGARTLNGAANQGGWDPAWNTLLPSDTTALLADLECNAFATWTDAPGANEERPANCISWSVAFAFCLWDGGYLPTEAQWNFAASGGAEQRAYPWSAPPSSLTLDASHASYWADTTQQCVGDMSAGCAVTDLTVVGSKPAGDGRWGHSDLGGNVREWVLDYYLPLTSPCNDCATLTPDMYVGVRGGSYEYGALALRASNRDYGTPRSHYSWVGIRCARDP